MQGEMSGQYDVLLPFLPWMDSEDLTPPVSAIELKAGPRRKTPDSLLLWRRMRLLLGCLMTSPSDDLLMDELAVDEADLVNGEER